MKSSIIFVLAFCLISCAEKKQVTKFCGYFSNSIETELISNSWFLNDIEQDSFPGISLGRAYNDLLNNYNMAPVVIAVIDTEIDINHEDLQNTFWINENEIPHNEKDDDQNGYIDDADGWNYLGNSSGENVLNTLYEYVRIVKDSSLYKNLDSKSFDYKQYRRAKKEYSLTLNKTRELTKVGKSYISDYAKGINYLHNHILDTLTKINVDRFLIKNPSLKDSVNGAILWINQDVSYNALIDNFNGIKRRYEYHLNSSYNDRAILNDDPFDLNNKQYGNPEIAKNLDKLYHGTMVAGVLSSKRSNGKGINGFGDFIKVMPICISTNGDENDKDMALAIRYATDNGANIINISSGKYYSKNYEWVQDAIRYASSKDVLIVVGAGNDNQNLEREDVYFFPNDIHPETGLEIANNFIRVGASSYDHHLKWDLSNYGAAEVDIFAPGNNIMVPKPFNKYDSVAGTSFASPLVAGVASLLRSTYPFLTAPEVKKILMDSSVKYDVLVDVPTKENPEQQLPFSDLSKSGGIVNAYNAILMAEGYVKSKK